ADEPRDEPAELDGVLERTVEVSLEIIERSGDERRVVRSALEPRPNVRHDERHELETRGVAAHLLDEHVVRALPALEHYRVAVETRERREVLDRPVAAERL